MGTGSKVFNVILRIGELCSALIVLGIVGHFLYIVGEAGTYADNRLIFAIVVASISTALSLLTLLPFTFAFLVFPVDLVLFVLWLVTYCLLQTLTGLNPCNSIWYYDYWGYYWGGYWRRPTFVVTGPWDIDWVGCGTWRTVLAFSLIASFIYLASAILGCIVTINLHEQRKELRVRHHALMDKTGPADGPLPGQNMQPIMLNMNGEGAGGDPRPPLPPGPRPTQVMV